MKRLITFVLVLVLASPCVGSASEQSELVFGVLATRLKARSTEQWRPLAVVLERQLGRPIELKVYDHGEFENALRGNLIDVVLADPGYFVTLQHHYGVSAPLVTLITQAGAAELTAYGGVVFTLADRPDVRGLADLETGTIAVASTESLGSYLAQAYELSRVGIKSRGRQLLLTGLPEDRVVHAVLRGEADAGFARTGLIEALSMDGTIDRARIRVINPQNLSSFPFASSTPLYPEWPVGVMPQVDDTLARRLVVALLSVPPGTVPGVAGFTVPADYSIVDKVMRELRVAPFDARPLFDARDVFQRYRVFILSIMAAGGAILMLVVLLAIGNRRLAAARREAADSARELAHHRDQLEDLVAERTAELAEGQTALADSESKLKLMIGHAPVALAMFDHQMRYLAVSRRWLQDYQLGDRDVVGLHHYEVFPEIPERWKAIHRRALHGEVVHAEEDSLSRSDSRTQWLRWEVRPWYRKDDTIGGIILFTEDISDRKRSEEDLRKASLYARSLIEASLDPLVTISPEGKITDVNVATENATGRSRADLIGSDFCDYFTEPEQARNGYLRVFSEGSVTDYPLAIRHASGKLTDVLYNATIYRDEAGRVEGVFAAARDISERKRVEAGMNSALNRLELAKNAADIGIWTWNFDDDSLEWDDRMRAWYEPPADIEQSGLYYEAWRSRLHPDDRVRCETSILRARSASARWDEQFRLVLPGGRVRFIQASAVVEYDPAGRSVRMIGINRDITEQQRLEDHLRAAKLAADAANQAKSDFLANMSHELRSPMNCILGMTGLVLETELSPHQRDYLGKVHAAAKALLRLLNDILDYSKIEAGQMDIERRPFDLGEVLRKVTDLLAVQLEEKGLSLRFGLAPSVPRRLVGDDFRLNQVLINLIGNAIKFTERGQVSLDVDTVKDSASGVVLRFTVRDTGIGMTSEQIVGLFAAFTQADASTTRKYGGTGLGLSISKRLVELMGGSLEVESRFGQGSRFSFTAWFLHGDGTTARGHVSDADLSELAVLLKPIEGRRILIVDDQQSNLEVAEALLKRLGLEPTCVHSGEAAVALVATHRFAAVLMDLQMSGVDGYEASRRINIRLGKDAPPILAVTAAVMDRDRQASQEAGMVEHIGKPIEPAELAAALLRRVLPENRPPRALKPVDRTLREDVERALRELEQLLRDRDISAAARAGAIEAGLADTGLAAHFAAVANATRKLRAKQAIDELERFREHLAHQPQEG